MSIEKFPCLRCRSYLAGTLVCTCVALALVPEKEPANMPHTEPMEPHPFAGQVIRDVVPYTVSLSGGSLIFPR
jgi:hypothetical protein